MKVFGIGERVASPLAKTNITAISKQSPNEKMSIGFGKKAYRELLEKLFTVGASGPDEDTWSEMMKELDTTFGQEEGYFEGRFATAESMFTDLEGVRELCEDDGAKSNFYELIEYTYDLEAFLEKTVLVQMFKRLTQEEMARFITDQHYRPRMEFGKAMWMLTSTFGKHDFQVRPIRFELFHNFSE